MLVFISGTRTSDTDKDTEIKGNPSWGFVTAVSTF